jgi:hypothetical protein
MAGDNEAVDAYHLDIVEAKKRSRLDQELLANLNSD